MIDLLFYGPFVQICCTSKILIFFITLVRRLVHWKKVYLWKKKIKKKKHRTVSCSISEASLLGVFFVGERSEVLEAADRCVPRIFRRGPRSLYWMV
jgi:hypothetical protein